MQSKTLFACLIVAVLVSTAFANLQKRKCGEGREFFDGCNKCICGAGGVKLCETNDCPKVWDEKLQKYVTVTRSETPSDFWEPIPEAPVPKQ